MPLTVASSTTGNSALVAVQPVFEFINKPLVLVFGE
jgi:hypothetical protein